MAENWQKLQLPIISPSEAWHLNAIYEPCVIHDDGKFKMWFSAGWGEASGIGYAESTDAQSWSVREGPVIGLGFGGVDGFATRISVIKHNGLYYAYFSDSGGTPGHLRLALSTDGINFNAHPVAIIPSGGVDTRIANSCIFIENGVWYCLYEAWTNNLWTIYLASSSDGKVWVKDPRGAVQSLRINPAGMSGGPTLAKVGRTFQAWTHNAVSGQLPTDIYHHHSANLFDWVHDNDGQAVLARSLSFEVDQLADPWVIEVSGRSYLFYSAMDNPNAGGRICLATIDAPLSSFCVGAPSTIPGPPPTGLIPPSSGTPFGDLGNANLAFDGVTSVPGNGCALKFAAGSGYLGKNFTGAPRAVSSAKWYGPNDNWMSGAASATLTLRGKHTAPANRTDGTALGSVTGMFADGANAVYVIPSNDAATLWEYVWVDVVLSGGSAPSTSLIAAELQFYNS